MDFTHSDIHPVHPAHLDPGSRAGEDPGFSPGLPLHKLRSEAEPPTDTQRGNKEFGPIWVDDSRLEA